MTKTIALLGATGSIGRQTLEVARELGISVAALTAHTQIDLLEQQARQFMPRLAVLYDPDAARELEGRLRGTGIEVLAGEEGLLAAASLDEADTVVTAVMGSVGLRPTLAAIEKGKRIALPNAEIMIHQPAAGTQGKVTDMEIDVERFLKIKARMNRIMAENTGKTPEQIKADSERDHWLLAEEAREYGLIDKVI